MDNVSENKSIVTHPDIVDALRSCGIAPGDTVMVHSSLKSFGRVEGGVETVIRALQDVVTPEGLVAFPAFSDCTDGGSQGPFDLENSPVEKWVGIIPETFRKSPGVFRGCHPTHSVCAWGRNAADFVKQDDPWNIFAPGSPWDKLYKQHGKILFFGETIGSNTFIHACEAWYNDYLYSIMAWVKMPEGAQQVKVTNYPGGCRGNWYSLRRKAPYYLEMEKRGVYHYGKVGDAVITWCYADEFARAMQELFAEDPAILLHKEGCSNCAVLRSYIK